MSDYCIICGEALDYPGIWCLRCQRIEWADAEAELAPDDDEDDEPQEEHGTDS